MKKQTIRSLIVPIVLKFIRLVNPNWNPKYTQSHEVKVLCDLAKCVDGTVVEIGCNEGATLCEIAKCVHPRKCIGVDWSGNRQIGLQSYEVPKPEKIGWIAKKHSNVIIIDSNSTMIEPWLEFHKPIKFIFIDGDHSWEGVDADTKIAFKLIESGGIIAWHDYNEDSPPFCKVWEYLNSLDIKLEKIDGTNIAVYRK